MLELISIMGAWMSRGIFEMKSAKFGEAVAMLPRDEPLRFSAENNRESLVAIVEMSSGSNSFLEDLILVQDERWRCG